jgi:hypothetical protein
MLKDFNHVFPRRKPIVILVGFAFEGDLIEPVAGDYTARTLPWIIGAGYEKRKCGCISICNGSYPVHQP